MSPRRSRCSLPFSSRPGGDTLQVFNPANAPTGAGQGFGLAIVFAIFALNGWDGAVLLAEESREPKRVVPRAVFLALIVMGFFLIICSWGILSGWGTNHIHSFVTSPEAPYIVLAKKFWSSAGVPILLLALLNSALAVTIASTNVTTRMWFSMARSGALPHGLARLSRRFKTPVNALFLQTIISLVAGLGVAALIGPAKVQLAAARGLPDHHHRGAHRRRLLLAQPGTGLSLRLGPVRDVGHGPLRHRARVRRVLGQQGRRGRAGPRYGSRLRAAGDPGQRRGSGVHRYPDDPFLHR
jgi:hypothetical protein